MTYIIKGAIKFHVLIHERIQSENSGPSWQSYLLGIGGVFRFIIRFAVACRKVSSLEMLRALYLPRILSLLVQSLFEKL